jgi:hypothetical protein
VLTSVATEKDDALGICVGIFILTVAELPTTPLSFVAV